MIGQVAFLALAVCGAVAVPVPAVAVEYPGAIYSQYHAQDELGQYTFGYSGPTSTKHEQKTADGVTRGTYSYVDATGRLQTRSYTADDINGFRVAASDLPVSQAADVTRGATSAYIAPAHQAAVQTATWQSSLSAPSRWALPGFFNGQVQDTPEVAAAKAQHLAAVEQARITNGIAGNSYFAGNPDPYYSSSAAFPLEHRYLTAFNNPAYYTQAAAAPMFGPQFALPSGLSSQYHAQDEAGQYTFGYANDMATKSETKSADGVTRGSFSYVDPNGQIQSRSYIADDTGFRVIASDLPQVNI